MAGLCFGIAASWAMPLSALRRETLIDLYQSHDGERVAFDSKTAQAGLGDRCDIGTMTKVFARKNIGYVYLNYRDIRGSQSVVDGDRGVGPRACINHDADRLA